MHSIWTRELMTLDPTKTYKVFHTVWYDVKTVGIFVTDLQFDEDVWYLVFEWTTRYEGEYPPTRFPIDPSLLVPSRDQGHDFLLQEPVEIPTSTGMTDLLSRHRKQWGDKAPAVVPVGSETGDDTILATTDGQTLSINYVDAAPTTPGLDPTRCRAIT